MEKLNLITVKTAAQRLGVSPKTVYGLCNKGKIRSFRVSDDSDHKRPRIVIDGDFLEQWIIQRMNESSR